MPLDNCLVEDSAKPNS